MPNPFDRGSSLANFAEVFGSCGPDWFIPLASARPLGDGVSFTRSDELESPPHREGDAGSSADVEAIWRQRYHVRLPGAAAQQEYGGPLDLITQLWRRPGSPRTSG